MTPFYPQRTCYGSEIVSDYGVKIMKLPTIIQGGMGVAISDWKLARSVSALGHLGVVSGTGLGPVLASRLQNGDPNGIFRQAMAAFPFQEPVQKILNRYFVPGGLAPNTPYKRPTMWSITPPVELNQLTVIANFVEVWLAKQGHNGQVGINLLEKVQLPNLTSLYGAMLADVDVVIMGAGVPIQIPGVLDDLAEHKAVSYRLDVIGADGDDDFRIHFDPEAVFPGITKALGSLQRPMFLPIISSNVLAQALLKRSTGEIDGFVVETPIAGGHNAPPRGAMTLNEDGEPIYGEKDLIDLEKLSALGKPFWLAGGFASPDKLQEALQAGAAGVQIGSAFAFCEESGMEPDIRRDVVEKVLAGAAHVHTSPLASPTGFPFKVVRLEDSLSEENVYAERERICDIGFLRLMYRREDGQIGYRCPAEPVAQYVKKGGKAEDTAGRTCLCHNLSATAGYANQRKSGYVEPPLVTSGDDLVNITRFIKAGATRYTAQDVIEHILG
jgi:nitronate monooxygenase